jgi:hypothetical protein
MLFEENEKIRKENLSKILRQRIVSHVVKLDEKDRLVYYHYFEIHHYYYY